MFGVRFPWPLVSVGLLAVVCTACFENAPERAGSGFFLTPCERDVEAPPPAVNGAECGTVSVPLDERQPELGEIDLFVKRWPAISAVSEPDPVFVIAGGPGQSATGVSDSLAQVFFNLRKKRDIVFVDQRGTGNSSAMECEDYGQDPLTLLQQESRSKTLTVLHQCAEAHRAQAPYVTTPYAVADLERVRQALGYQKVNIWGGSYGTRVALEYVRAHRPVVRSIVLDGAAPAAIALPFTMGASARQSLQMIAQQCVDNAECFSRYGNPAENARKVAGQLAERPVRVDIDNPLTGLPQTVVLDTDKFSSLVRMALYDRLISKILPHVLADAAIGNFQLLAKMISQLFTSNAFSQLAMGMHFSVICSEDAQFPNPPPPLDFLNVDVSELMLQVCDFWPKGQLPEGYYQPVMSDVPSLILSGLRDPVTPPEWGQSVAEGLSQAIHVVAPGAHHGVTLQGCGGKLITQFIRNLTLTEAEQNCVSHIQPLAPYLRAEKSQNEGGES